MGDEIPESTRKKSEAGKRGRRNHLARNPNEARRLALKRRSDRDARRKLDARKAKNADKRARSLDDSAGNFGELNLHIVRRVREARECAGFSQQQLAEAVSKTKAWLSGVELGSTSISLLNIELLASALRVPILDLLPDWVQDADDTDDTDD